MEKNFRYCVRTLGVTERIRVATPPLKPTLIYDGNCGFCRRWIERWRETTGDAVEYIASQDAQIATAFPEIPQERFDQAVQFIGLDGSVSDGAEAAFRALAQAPGHKWALWCYQNVPGAGPVSEASYRFVAKRRTFFSWLTRLLWGDDVRRPSHRLVRWTFLRALGIVYFIAFVSLWTQIDGLVGSNGIAPAERMMQSLREQTGANISWFERFRVEPTFCWFSASDSFLRFQCGAGTVLAIFLVFGMAPIPCLLLLWLLYLSLATVCQTFLGYQWDNLLLEIGFLAIFFAPLRLWSNLRNEAQPSRIVLWLLRWLLFRLMFASGCVKLLSGDKLWNNLTALAVHYETQPLPTWLGWYAHQLPEWIQKASCGAMFFIELVVPFLIFCPRRLRLAAVWPFMLLQVVVLLTGNYCFFNLLTLVLCVILFDDAGLLKCIPHRWRDQLSRMLERSADISGRESKPSVLRGEWPCSAWLQRVRTICVAGVAGVILLVTAIQLVGMFRVRVTWPSFMVGLYQTVAPFRSVNGYGLFAVMTPSRPEIIVEGSNDGQTWLAYEFKYKPGDIQRPPAFVAPHQPRLDWQMWFAALGEVRGNPWYVNFAVRLLEGSPDVLKLMETNPFPNAPPKFIRATLYDYRFTDFKIRRTTGEWWRRERKGEYCPPISLRRE